MCHGLPGCAPFLMGEAVKIHRSIGYSVGVDLVSRGYVALLMIFGVVRKVVPTKWECLLKTSRFWTVKVVND